jgi:hypothetical protein
MRHEIFDRHGRRVERDGLIEDGDTLKVPMQFRDGLSPVQQAIAADADVRRSRARLVDAFGSSEYVGHRPGPVYTSDASAYSEVERAHQEMIKDHAEAWRDDNNRQQEFLFTPAGRHNATGFGSKEFAGAHEGDVCTVSGPEYPADFGSRGHLRRIGNKLVCVPDKPRSRDAMPTGPIHDAVEGQRIKDEAYREMLRARAEAWRR